MDAAGACGEREGGRECGREGGLPARECELRGFCGYAGQIMVGERDVVWVVDERVGCSFIATPAIGTAKSRMPMVNRVQQRHLRDRQNPSEHHHY
jgi:hypothetical protein